MRQSKKLSRRDVLVGHAAIVTLAGVSGAASADTAQMFNFKNSSWESLSAHELSQHVGDRFYVCSEGCDSKQLRLRSVDRIYSGPDRPAELARKEGLVATFETRNMKPFLDVGHNIYTIDHPQLGKADIFLGPVAENGGYVIEMILN